MFGSKRSQEGEAGEKCRNTINDYGSKQYLTPSHVQTVTIPFPYFVDGQRNLNIHCFDFFLLLETDE